MADSLLFDGSDDLRAFSAGNYSGAGAMSIACIVKPTTLAASSQFFVNYNTAGSAGVLVDVTTLTVYDGTNVRTGPTVVNDEWWLLGYSKAAGTVTPRYHTYRYSTTTWAHGNFSGTTVSAASSGVQWMQSGAEPMGGSLLIGAVWDSNLADAAFEELECLKDNWIAAAPDEAWRFDTTGAITPFVGTSTQTASTGGTLDTGDVPVCWDDAPQDPPVPPTAGFYWLTA